MRNAIRSGSWLTQERLLVYPLMLGTVGTLALLFNWFTGTTPLTDRLGKPIGTDFSAFYTAGRMLLEGHVAGIFDPATHFDYQSDHFGDPWVEHYGWHYPPFFLLVALVVSLMPYVLALVVWQAATFTLFARTVVAIVPKHPVVLAAAFGAPATLLTFAHGHNAFLSAALLGSGLAMLDRRPLLAGVLIGLLAYKPQFGIVLPVVLMAGGYWRSIGSAVVTVVAMAIVSTLVLGADVWPAFFKGAVFTREVVLEQGATGWYKIQSVFSAVRSTGGSIGLAYAAQSLVTVSVVLVLATLTISGADRRLVAAATATAALLATPYCLDYDLTILGISIAFLVAHAAEHGFDPYEKSLLAAVWAMPMVARIGMMATGFPIAVTVMLVLFVFIARKAAVRAGLELPSNWRYARG